jgi:hypothetical protein
MNCLKCGLFNAGNLAVGLAMPQCMCQWQQPVQTNWPFPPPTGPVPWTPKQKQEYERKQRQQLPEDEDEGLD